MTIYIWSPWGRGLAAGQDARHRVRLCRAPGRLFVIFILQAVQAGAGLGDTLGEPLRRFGRRESAVEAGAAAWIRAGGPDGGFRPRAQFERRGGLMPLQVSVLCREQECARSPDRWLGRASALAALVPLEASAAPRLKRLAWARGPSDFVSLLLLVAPGLGWPGNADGCARSRPSAEYWISPERRGTDLRIVAAGGTRHR
ncbi:hypothetical protein NDU88_007505 [Pleurodeles waltl]|uniref:Uncharacterized protein n=1 Tax=Pleurodeles waltl TaxID=8319 RepID=A0AAV7SSQ2_PLEWA|nr:hypothetical protein NDU88_007505 [Pleurodeles waltl]